MAGLASAVMGTPPTHGRGKEAEGEGEEASELCCEEAAGAARQTSSELVEFPSLADAPRTSLATFLLARMSFPTTAPSYRVPSDIIARLREARIGVAVFTAGLDVLHTPQQEAWKAIPGVVFKHYPWIDHAVLCTSISRLRLWRRPELWLDALAARL
uniref:Uncharacterized protein n=1 Tax=Alexandrium catenella TaxID=2925 RepID=A0A7S1MTA6_ALECA